MEHRFEIFADYSQFYLQDDDERFGQAQGWSDEAIETMLCSARM
jgi:hypothetical protein